MAERWRGARKGREREAHCYSVFAVRRTLMNVHTSHLLFSGEPRSSDCTVCYFGCRFAPSAPELVSNLHCKCLEPLTLGIVCSRSDSVDTEKERERQHFFFFWERVDSFN